MAASSSGAGLLPQVFGMFHPQVGGTIGLVQLPWIDLGGANHVKGVRHFGEDLALQNRIGFAGQQNQRALEGVLRKLLAQMIVPKAQRRG